MLLGISINVSILTNEIVRLFVFLGGNAMEKDYKHEILELIDSIDNNAFWCLVYKFIIAAKKKWGV